jgi:hypothetical protein
MAIKRSAATQEGSAYDLPEPSYDAELVQVGRRTPCGEMLRRYWHPIATAEEVEDLPLPVRVLGEDLILFQTPQGRYGLVLSALRASRKQLDLRQGRRARNPLLLPWLVVRY